LANGEPHCFDQVWLQAEVGKVQVVSLICSEVGYFVGLHIKILILTWNFLVQLSEFGRGPLPPLATGLSASLSVNSTSLA